MPLEAFSIDAAHSLVAGTSGWAGGSQIEIFRSTGLSWAIAEVASRPSSADRQRHSELLHGRSSQLFVTPTISAHDNSANRVYSAAQWMIRSLPGTPRSTCWSPASTRASRSTTRWPATRASPALDPRDRAFVRLLLATTLRRLGEIDEVLGELIERPLEGRQCRRPPGAAPGRRAARCSSARPPMPPSIPRCGWSSMPACRISRAWPTPCCAASRARASRCWATAIRPGSTRRTGCGRAGSATYGEEATRAIAAAHLIEAPLDLTPRADADFWAGRLEGEMLPTGTHPPRGRRRHRRAAGLRRGRVVGAGRRRHPARPPAGRRRRQARRRSLRRAGRQDDAALRRRRAGDGRRHLGAAA